MHVLTQRQNLLIIQTMFCYLNLLSHNKGIIRLFTIYKKFPENSADKWNTAFRVVPVENFSKQQNLWKDSLVFFRTDSSKQKLILVSGFRGRFLGTLYSTWFRFRFRFRQKEPICTNDKHDSGMKFTSPEFYHLTICPNRERTGNLSL